MFDCGVSVYSTIKKAFDNTEKNNMEEDNMEENEYDVYLDLKVKVISIETFLGKKDEKMWKMKLENAQKDCDPFKITFFVHGNLALRDDYKVGDFFHLIVANDDLVRSNRLSTNGADLNNNKLVFWDPDDGHKKHTKLTIKMMDNYDYSKELEKIKEGIYSIRIE